LRLQYFSSRTVQISSLEKTFVTTSGPRYSILRLVIVQSLLCDIDYSISAGFVCLAPRIIKKNSSLVTRIVAIGLAPGRGGLQRPKFINSEKLSKRDPAQKADTRAYKKLHDPLRNVSLNVCSIGKRSQMVISDQRTSVGKRSQVPGAR
jgi:hypothetical protein